MLFRSLRQVTDIFIGGVGTLVPQMEIAGIVLSSNEAGIPIVDAEGLTAGAAGDINARIANLTWVSPVALTTITGGVYTTQTLTGDWHGRKLTDVMAEHMATCSGYWWSRSYDSVTVAVPGNKTYPAAIGVTIDIDTDCIGAPTLLDAAESRPTRCVVNYPAGRATVIDTAAEADPTFDGSTREVSINTIAVDYPAAEALGTAVLAQSALGLRITKLVVDLETAAHDLVPTLFDSSTDLGGLYPTMRMRIVSLPASHFGATARDVHVQGWTEVYEEAGCHIEFDLSPAYTAVTVVTVNDPGSQSWSVGVAVSLTITGSSSGGGALTYTATGLPAGLSISSGGLISGTPSTPSSGSITVTGTDSFGSTGMATFSWTVTAGGTPYVLPTSQNAVLLALGG